MRVFWVANVLQYRSIGGGTFRAVRHRLRDTTFSRSGRLHSFYTEPSPLPQIRARKRSYTTTRQYGETSFPEGEARKDESTNLDAAGPSSGVQRVLGGLDMTRGSYKPTPGQEADKYSQAPQRQSWPQPGHTAKLSDEDRDHLRQFPNRLSSVALRASLLSQQQKAGFEPLNVKLESRHIEEDPTSTTANDDADGTERDDASLAEQRRIERVSLKEIRSRSRTLLAAARLDDKSLWVACETQIFSLLAQVNQPSNQETVHQVGALGSPEHVEPLEAASESDGASEDKLPEKASMVRFLPVVSTILPVLLLFALRLFTKSYPTSPYTLTMLPHLRSLGLKPYVLSTSTAFFNTLLRHRWDVYSDVGGMEQLLQEMKNGGIEFDAETYDLLVDVRRQWSESNGQRVDSGSGEGKGREILKIKEQVGFAGEYEGTEDDG